jgi:hypothetical protein
MPGEIWKSMSNMENLETQLNERERQAAVYAEAMKSVQSEKRRQEAQGYAVLAGALGYGEGALGKGKFGKITHAAKLFLIAFAFLTPSLLIWQVLL